MITVTGNSLLNQKSYLEFTQLDENISYSDLTLHGIKNRFEKHPYIIRSEVKSDGRGNVEVYLKEKIIYAVVVGSSDPYFITADFQVIPIFPNTIFSDLPVISNARLREKFNAMNFMKDEDIIQAFRIIDAAKTTDLELSKKLAEINLRNGGDVVLTFSGISSPVIFGRGNEAKKMIYLNILWERMNEQKNYFENTEYLDLRFSNEVFVGRKDNIGL
ncbi:MAG: cell division protein FtsQ/DivIB [Ignavibacteriaceae bacterium]